MTYFDDRQAIPHRAREDYVYQGYTISKGDVVCSVVLVHDIGLVILILAHAKHLVCMHWLDVSLTSIPIFSGTFCTIQSCIRIP